MYWRWSQIPELADLPPGERKRIWREARRDPFRAADLLWVAAILGVVLGAAMAVIELPTRLSGWVSLTAYVVVVLALGVVVDAILILRYRPIVRRLVGRR